MEVERLKAFDLFCGVCAELSGYIYQMKNIIEAHRYIDNAKEILRDKAQKEDSRYHDRKYVRMAGHTAYLAILVALDGLFGIKKKGRKKVEWYQEQLAKLDKKMLNSFLNAYEILHLGMGYDGDLSAAIAHEGLKESE